MNKRPAYRVCPKCGAHLDSCEICDCTKCTKITGEPSATKGVQK